MSDRLLVATRKGLFVLRADGEGGWTLSEPYFVGEPVSMVLPDPRDGALYAALNLGHFGVKLHRRRAGMADWEACAVPVYPPQPADETRAADGANAGANASADNASAAAPSPPSPPWTLQQIWSLETGGPDEPGVLWPARFPVGSSVPTMVATHGCSTARCGIARSAANGSEAATTRRASIP